MEQELAELRGERSGLPPVVLSPPMALQFRREIQNNGSNNTDAILIYDHELSEEWANQLRTQCILPAEEIRHQEDLRPLAYQLNPEPWQRLRPSIESKALLTVRRNEDEGIRRQQSDADTGAAEPIDTDIIPESCAWISMICRPLYPKASSPFTMHHDSILSIVFEYIHRETPYYVSCGAKFGSDMLIYDGPRDQRHAFAGLRVLSSTTTYTSPASSESSRIDTNSQPNEPSTSSLLLPIPTAYSLTSFVRCLNTAGKLALLATVVRDEETEDDINGRSGEESARLKHKYRVLLVDVALEKVLDAPTHKRRRGSSSKKQQKRKDMTKNLAKN